MAGEIRYGRSDDVPSRLGEHPTGLASVIVLASADADATSACVAALGTHAPVGVDLVIVDDAYGVGVPAAGGGSRELELVRTSARLGAGAARNIGIRRARAPIVLLVDPRATLTGDVVTPLVDALSDSTVAVAGFSGVTSSDMQRFEPVAPADGAIEVAAIDGPIVAFRRDDAAQRGSIDEAFRSPEYLGIWWSLVLRDGGEDGAPRRAVVVHGPVDVGAAPNGNPSAPTERGRAARRNFYRLLDAFRTRLDLAIPGASR